MHIDARIARLRSLDREHIWHPFTQMADWAKSDPLIITEASGCFLKDVRGGWYLDGVSSLWVNILGHRRKEIDEAIKAQLGKVAHSTLLGMASEASSELAGKLAALVQKSFGAGRLTRIFFSDDGSTSVEVALKMAFQYWAHKGEKQRTLFISLENGYHGDTLGSVSVGGVDIFHSAFKPLLFRTGKAPSPYCYRCPLGLTRPGCGLECAAALERLVEANRDTVAGVVLEPMVQAAGGMIFFPAGYLKRVSEICNRHGVPFIADEVATGFGRTGKTFACEHEGVVPDILCLSKGLTGGYLPLAVTVANDKIYNAFLGGYEELKTFFHGHSYTGNPLGCAAASAVLDIFDKEDIPGMAAPKAAILKNWLRDMETRQFVGEARGLGLMAGVELVADKETKKHFPWEQRVGWKVALKALEKGLFIRPLGNVIVIMPPLSVSQPNLERMLEVIAEAVSECAG